MVQTTTNYALPYPEPADGVDIWTYFQDLAEAVDTALAASAKRYMTQLVLTADQSIPNNTITSVLFGSGTELVDDLGWHSTSSNTSRVTPTLPGRYLVIGNPYFAANATADRRAYLAKNGAQSSAWGRAVANGSNGLTDPAMAVLTANGTTDYFELQVFQLTGGALNVQGAGDTTFSTRFEVIYLGTS